MSADLLTVSPQATVREAAQQMSQRSAGAALLVDAAVGGVGGYSGILTERDMLTSIAAGQNPDTQDVSGIATSDVVTVMIDSSLEDAVAKMLEGNFRHLVVLHEGDAVGIVSMRDLVKALANQ